MKAFIVSLFAMLICVSFVFADVPPTFEEVKAQLEAEITPTLVLELTNEAAADLRSQNLIPNDLLSYFPNASYVPLLTIPVNPVHEELWRTYGLHRWFIVRNIDNPPSRAALQSIESLESVTTAEFSALHIMDLTPMDEGNFNTYAMDRMQATQAWDQQIGSDDVIVTTIDTGCEISHPDLQHNIHVNPGEDLNGNGYWDASDSNGIDDDGNGYVDDLVGWDFVSATVSPLFRHPAEDYGPRDNRVWPDIVGHGTHVSGTTASTTNNGIGVPSASWNVSNMPLRAGYAYSLFGLILGVGDTADFIAAIQYAGENGSDIVSISFGGTGSNQFYQDTINYVRSLGTLIFASAGNSNNQVVNYPAGYDNVISVAATDINDVRASFSTYGSWVDISSPGVNIWSTTPGASYSSYDGTSMSSPNAAAVAALVKSYNPSMTAAHLEQFILNGCDNIDAQNPGYIGLLGAGRVNALNSLNLASAAYPASASPNVDLVPVISPTNVPAAGGSFLYNVTISNNTGAAQTFDAWTMALMPDGSMYGPILTQTSYGMAVGATSQFTLSLAVPGAAPVGLYRFIANIGSLGGTIWESDDLYFSKAGVAAGSLEDWTGDSWPEVSGNNGGTSTLPLSFEVGQAFPNPFNAMTTLNVQLPETATLNVIVFDVMGRKVATVVNDKYSSGNHTVSVNASSFSSGMYFIQTSVPGKLKHTQKVILVK